MTAPIRLPRAPLQGNGVALRAWREDDIGAIAAMSRDPETVRFTSVPDGFDESDARIWLALQPSRLRAGDGVAFAITAPPDDRPLGSIGVRVLHGRGAAEVGYHMAADARGRGLATAALEVVSQWAFEALAVARLQLTTHEDNPASQRVAEKAGYTREALLRSWADQRGRRVDLVMWSLLPPDLDR